MVAKYWMKKFPDEKNCQDDKDPDLNYFDDINIPSKETTYIFKSDMKNFI